MRNRQLQIINLIAFFVLAIFNFMAVRIPFFGRRPGAVSDLYPNPFTPPDFSFKIWPVIYTLLGIFAIQQASGLFSKSKSTPKKVGEVGLLFPLACLFNFAWLTTWQSLHLSLSFFILVALWATLILIYYRLAPFSRSNWMLTLPFSWYLAWVAVAGLANLNVVLIAGGFGFFGLSPEIVAVILCGVGVFGGLLVLYLNQDWWFVLALIWALFGIFVKNGWGMVGSFCLLGIFILTASGAYVAWKKEWKGNA